MSKCIPIVSFRSGSTKPASSLGPSPPDDVDVQLPRLSNTRKTKTFIRQPYGQLSHTFKSTVFYSPEKQQVITATPLKTYKMVKILENQLIDLDIMPGAKPADLLAKASAIEQQNPQKAEALRALAEQKAKVLKNEMERKTAGMPLGGSAAAPEEEVPQQGGFVGGVKGVGMGLVNTVGALGKGVGDTLGNTVSPYLFFSLFVPGG